MMHDGIPNFNLYVVGLFLILIIIAIFIANDAASRGYNGFLWALAVVLMPMMGLFIYLIFVAINPRAKSYDVNTSGYNRPQPAVATPSAGNTYAEPKYTGTTFTPTTPVSNPVSKPTSPVTNPVSGDIRYCTVCGSVVPNNSKFCNSCGAKIPEV